MANVAKMRLLLVVAKKKLPILGCTILGMAVEIIEFQIPDISVFSGSGLFLHRKPSSMPRTCPSHLIFLVWTTFIAEETSNVSEGARRICCPSYNIWPLGHVLGMLDDSRNSAAHSAGLNVVISAANFKLPENNNFGVAKTVAESIAFGQTLSYAKRMTFGMAKITAENSCFGCSQNCSRKLLFRLEPKVQLKVTLSAQPKLYGTYPTDKKKG
ncbi:hypothetical protein DFH07DRAFT_775757 [Mycena maculata]|uniref:Uncharacterized protein n=1 Tax=Mycena maculata TaxID=230809 RepID=A0AAD7ITG7_9AGAR|nr:hypothetical protein DFH07DRAFT_775757 [Mycena maculata]